MFCIRSLIIFLLLESPIAVIVPSIVEMSVAKTATESDTYTAFIIDPSFISLSYHLSENPVRFVSDFELLNENTIITTIGR